MRRRWLAVLAVLAVAPGGLACGRGPRYCPDCSYIVGFAEKGGLDDDDRRQLARLKSEYRDKRIALDAFDLAAGKTREPWDCDCPCHSLPSSAPHP